MSIAAERGSGSNHKGVPTRPFVSPLRYDRRRVKLQKWEKALIAARYSEAWPVRLWAGVLYDAYFTVMRTPMWERFSETLRWFRSTADEPLGTFESICVVLDLEAESVRRDVLRKARTQSLYARRRTHG